MLLGYLSALSNSINLSIPLCNMCFFHTPGKDSMSCCLRQTELSISYLYVYTRIQRLSNCYSCLRLLKNQSHYICHGDSKTELPHSRLKELDSFCSIRL